MTSESTITSKGQITIPASIRQAMGLEPGVKIGFTQLSNGTTVMRVKSRSALDLAGMLKKPGGRKVAIQDMNIGQP